MKTPESSESNSVYRLHELVVKGFPITWKCPYCGTLQSTRQENVDTCVLYPLPTQLKVIATYCLNHKCRKFSVFCFSGDPMEKRTEFDGLVFPLRPEPLFIDLPDYIHTELIEDYKQAYRILELSPKASATLSRRCLEGMIITKWPKLKNKKNLQIMIDALVEEAESSKLVEALQVVRDIGNIGAHMQEADKITEVDPEEAEILIQLLEDLFKLWFIDDHDRAERLERISSRGTRLKKSTKS